MIKPVKHLPESNFTIVLPGPCNARCGFCFWERSGDEASITTYAQNLRAELERLPKSFYMISISGGEPTLSPYLNPALDVIASLKEKFPKVVLTTNGHHLHSVDFERFEKAVDFVNISRHRVDENENGKVFGTSNVPEKAHITRNIDKLEGFGIPVRLNCVIPAETENWQDFMEVLEYIQFAKDVGANSIAFRVDHRNGMSKHELHQFMDSNYRMLREGGCPVCKSYYYRLRGMDVIWKYSIVEPSVETIQKEGGIFELIYQPNGTLTADWDGKMQVFTTDNGDLCMDFPERVLDEDELKKALDVINALSEGAKVKRGLIDLKNEIIGRITPKERVVTQEVHSPISSGGCGVGYVGGGCGGYSGGCGSSVPKRSYNYGGCGGGYSGGGC